MSFKKFLNIILFFLLAFPSLFSQNVIVKDSVFWEPPVEYGLEGQEKEKCLYFKSAQFDYKVNSLPFYYREIKLPKSSKAVKVALKKVKYENLTIAENEVVNRNEVPNKLDVELQSGIIQKNTVSYLTFFPIVKSSSAQLQKVTYFEVEVEYVPTLNRRSKSLSFATQSVLSSGEWYKIATTKSGVYKLTPTFLRKLGIDVASVNPRNIRLFGNGGGMLPRANSEPRPDDLIENAIYVEGENDGRFDANDFIAFYGEGQVEWKFDSVKNRFQHQLHRYSDTVFYYLNIGDVAGKRIVVEQAQIQTPNQQVTTFNDYAYHENDERNLLKSGWTWLGEVFDNQLAYNFNFNFPKIDLNSAVIADVKVVARAGVLSKFEVSSGNNSVDIDMSNVAVNRYEATYASGNSGSLSFSPPSSVVNLRIAYNKPQAIAKGWLDYITVNARRNLSYNNEQLFFRDVNSVGVGNVSEFKLQSNNSLKVWELTDKYNIIEKQTNENGNLLTFVSPTEMLREFVAFRNYDSTNVFIKGRVTNQNLHAYAQAELLIVSHPMFINQAKQLGDFHRSEGLRVHVVTTQEVYNEYSSGSQDPIAIRSFAKMFYDRAINNEDLPKYLLLYGDASYDFKDRFSGNTNFVVSYESPNSFDPVGSYVSDDFMALLDDSEGIWPYSGVLDKVDLGVGRLPVKNVREAEGVLNKIRNYNLQKNMGDWQNKIVFIGDDGDGGLHMVQSRDLANLVEGKNQGYNLEKIFLGAFQKQFTPAGPRFPEVNKRIDRAVSNGALVVNYTGHGGETGWAEERVLDIRMINAWDNIEKLPLFMTATCEFSRFDDPLRTSAGELVLLNPNGGGIALMTTTRLVYANQNYWLSVSFYNRLLQKNPNGEVKRLGQIAMEVKNDNANQLNTRNFTLLGDPALKLAIPKYGVTTTGIFKSDSSRMDTAKALSEVTIEGFVNDDNGQIINGYNGNLYTTVYDKPRSVNAGNNLIFKSQEARIFKGKVSINDGRFRFKFVVPKDIDYNYGFGRVSYFTENGIEAGSDAFDSLLIGGSGEDINRDKEGPEISLYLNDRSFVYGGITDNQPVLIADLKDDLGINTVGNGVGHDLIAIIDDDTENTIVLNDYYEANTDDFTSGKIQFPMHEFKEGKHKLTLKAWDVANNSSEKSIEFNVRDDREVKIDHLVNYPNPFTTNTEFIFQHNQAGLPLSVKIEIFTVSGKLVKSIDRTIVNQGYLSRDISWDGRDDFGDRIGKGVYVYRLKIRSGNGSQAEKIEKLVIL